MDAIPAELKARRQWVTWQYIDGQKVPNGKSNDPSTWGDFPLVGNPGFVFSADDPYCGIDLDDCITEDGLTEQASEVLGKFRGLAYAEISPSGAGIKITTRGKKKANTRCSVGGWLECYEHARFWAMTGNVLEGFEAIGDGQDALNWLCDKYLTVVRTYVPTVRISKALSDRAWAYVEAADLPAEGGRNNAAFRLSGHLAAMIGDDGERLDGGEILEMMAWWNNRLLSPLSEKELAAVTKSSSQNGTPRPDKESEVRIVEFVPIDWAKLNSQREADEIDDEEFCQAIIPVSGLLREIHQFYGQKAYRRSHVMGLACAVALCETVFGRRIRSHTDLRTNDYNLILATTGAGKEACESTITALLDAADTSGASMIPPDVQSGNGLMKAVACNPNAIWVCDEFGKILQAMLDKKGNQHVRNIGNHLLKLYGKSSGTYGGAAHSDGVRNRIVQPCLTVLGLSTSSTVFDAVSTEQVSDGLIGRIAFWPVQNRPTPREDMSIVAPPKELVKRLSSWLSWKPVTSSDYPQPATLGMSDEAKGRWAQHAREINGKMESETELRAAIWSRVAARTMKLAMVHRAARLETMPATTHWEFVLVEKEDTDWAIGLSNWLARIACGLVRENVYDKSGIKAKAILIKALESGEVHKRTILRAYRSLTAGDLQAAADELGLITVTDKSTNGRPRIVYKRPEN
jgi:hypothetical protein